MTFYGTLATGAGLDRAQEVHRAGRRRRLQEAPHRSRPVQVREPHARASSWSWRPNEGYWRKVPSVKRLVFKSVPEATTRLAMLKRGEVDIAYLLDAPQAQEVKRDPNLKLAFSGGDRRSSSSTSSTSGIRSPPGTTGACAWPRAYAIDRQALNEAETLGRLPAHRQHRSAHLRVRPALEPDPYDPAKAKQLLAEAGYPNGFDAGRASTRIPPTSRWARPSCDYLGAVGIRTKMRTMERAAFYAGVAVEEAAGRVRVRQRLVRQRRLAHVGVRARATGTTPTAAIPTSTRSTSSRRVETDRKKREAMLHQIQQLLHERVRFAPDLGVHLAERDRAAGGGARADADQSLPLVGASRRRDPRGSDRALSS